MSTSPAAAITREAAALSQRLDRLDRDTDDAEAIVTLIHDLGSTLALFQDLPASPGDVRPIFGFVGRLAAAQMQLVELLAVALARDRDADQVEERRRVSDRRVLGSLLELSALLNLLLAAVALRG